MMMTQAKFICKNMCEVNELSGIIFIYYGNNARANASRAVMRFIIVWPPEYRGSIFWCVCIIFYFLFG